MLNDSNHKKKDITPQNISSFSQNYNFRQNQDSFADKSNKSIEEDGKSLSALSASIRKEVAKSFIP